MQNLQIRRANYSGKERRRGNVISSLLRRIISLAGAWSETTYSPAQKKKRLRVARLER
jgi:hypothetical protein